VESQRSSIHPRIQPIGNQVSKMRPLNVGHTNPLSGQTDDPDSGHAADQRQFRNPSSAGSRVLEDAVLVRLQQLGR
jgi:hypothetical protein